MRLTICMSGVVALLLVLPSSSWGMTPEVRDQAGFFKPETVTKADELIREIKNKHKKDLLIETFRHVPAGDEKEATSSDPKEKEHYFNEWALRRAREAQVNGIYVLICREPPHVKVAVGMQTHKVFTDEERNHLGSLLVDRFRKKEYDEGLLEGVRYVESALKEAGATVHEPDTTHHAGSGGHFGGVGGDGSSSTESAGPALGGSLCVIVGGLLCVGLVVIVGIGMLIRAFTGGGGGGYGPSGYSGGYGGGGGFGGGFGGMVSSFAASMLGSAAGMWMYNNMFGGGSHSWSQPTQPGPTTGGGSFDSPATTPEDTDYTAGGGGDFSSNADKAGGGDQGGGGDFSGGNDAGGGDQGGGGGGDFGGGGGDFGGGGGDSGGGGGGDAGGGVDF